MDASHINSFLEYFKNTEVTQCDYRYSKNQNYWKLTHKGLSIPCEIFIELAGDRVHCYIPLEITIWPQCRLAVYRFVLRLNEEMSEVKFGLSHDGKLALIADLTGSGQEFAQLFSTIKMMLSYLEMYFFDIRALAQDHDLANYVNILEDSKNATEEIIVLIKEE